MPALRAMAELGMPLLVHGEVTDDEVDMFDREAVFIQTKLVCRATTGGVGPPSVPGHCNLPPPPPRPPLPPTPISRNTNNPL